MNIFQYGVIVLFTVSAPAGAADTLWKCHDPDRPVRFAYTEKDKAHPPACYTWVEIRGNNLTLLLRLAGSGERTSADNFLGEILSSSGIAHSVPSFGGSTATSEIYANPGRYGFRSVSIENARPGSVVVYEGAAGIIVESRVSKNDTWSKQVLYTGEETDNFLEVSDLFAPGMSSPRVIVPN